MRKGVLEGVLQHIITDIQPNYAALAKQYNCDYRTVKRYYEADMKGNINQLRKRQSSVSPLLCGFEEIIRDKLELSCSASSIYYFIKVATPQSNVIAGIIVKSEFKRRLFELKRPLVFQLKLIWICVNKVDSFFESFFEPNPLSSCFMISDNRQTKTV